MFCCKDVHHGINYSTRTQGTKLDSNFRGSTKERSFVFEAACSRQTPWRGNVAVTGVYGIRSGGEGRQRTDGQRGSVSVPRITELIRGWGTAPDRALWLQNGVALWHSAQKGRGEGSGRHSLRRSSVLPTMGRCFSFSFLLLFFFFFLICTGYFSDFFFFNVG